MRPHVALALAPRLRQALLRSSYAKAMTLEAEGRVFGKPPAAEEWHKSENAEFTCRI